MARKTLFWRMQWKKNPTKTPSNNKRQFIERRVTSVDSETKGELKNFEGFQLVGPLASIRNGSHIAALQPAC